MVDYEAVVKSTDNSSVFSSSFIPGVFDDIDAGRIRMQHRQRRRLLPRRTRRRLRRGIRTHGSNSPEDSRRSGSKGVDAKREGDGWKAVSPTGSAHSLAAMRVANDRVATSRTRLHDGHEAPMPCRPRNRVDSDMMSETASPRAPFTTGQGPPRPYRGDPVRAAGGRQQGCMDSFGGGGY